MTQLISQCLLCKHFKGGMAEEDGPSCTAFPLIIPDMILMNQVDHRQEVDGDHGIQWEKTDDAFMDHPMDI